MAYIPWWQRMSPPTFAERFELGGLAKKKNPTLVKNMKNVKWKSIPPLKGPDPRGLIKDPKQDKPDQLEKLHGRNR